MNKTEKVYYQDFFLSKCEAKIIAADNDKIVLDRTVAFPEGGGQEGDRGVLITGDIMVEFFDTKKGIGRLLHLQGFPAVQVESPVCHIIKDEDAGRLKVGDEVIVRIDVQHRIGTTVMHSGLHIALMAATERAPEKVKYIKGCSITDHSARLDFFTEERFTAEDMEWINKRAQEIVDNGYMIKSYPHPDEPEAWYWECENFRCACGGTHVLNTGDIGKIHVKRKSIGKTMERLSISLSDIRLSELDYH